MKVREATTKDLMAILELFEQSIRQSCSDDYSPEQIEVWIAGKNNTARWEKAIAEQYFLVAETDSGLLGFASLINDYIDFLYVHPNHQGKGIANQLLHYLIRKTEETAIPELRTYASITAKSFFLKNGFEQVQKNDLIRHGVSLSNYSMSKIMKLRNPLNR